MLPSFKFRREPIKACYKQKKYKINERNKEKIKKWVLTAK